MYEEKIKELYNKEKALHEKAVENREAIGEYMTFEEFVQAGGFLPEGKEDE